MAMRTDRLPEGNRLIEAARDIGPLPGGLSSHFHLSLDGTRVLNFPMPRFKSRTGDGVQNLICNPSCTRCMTVRSARTFSDHADRRFCLSQLRLREVDPRPLEPAGEDVLRDGRLLGGEPNASGHQVVRRRC